MRDRSLVEKAQNLHGSGMRVCDISREFNKSSNVISRWCRKSSPLFKLDGHNSYQEEKRRIWYNYDRNFVRSINQNTAKLLLSTLYWCEGCKYPGTNRVEFVSSDEKMQVTFIKLMRLAFANELHESKFRVLLQLHTTHNISTQINYWSSLLNIPVEQFIKPHITFEKNSRYRHIYNGTCSVRYNDYRILLRIMGIYDRSAQKINNLLI